MLSGLRKLITTLVLAGLLLTGQALAPSALADTHPSDATARALARLADPAAMAQATAAADPAVISQNREELASATALVDFFATLSQGDMFLNYLAATLSQEEIDDMAERLAGHHFELRIDAETSRPILTLAPGTAAPYIDPSVRLGAVTADAGGIRPMDVTYGYACWEAYAAAAAFALGTGLLCAPLAGWALVCSVGSSVLFPINWNSACKPTPGGGGGSW